MASHKYTSKEPKPGGGWYYRYDDLQSEAKRNSSGLSTSPGQYLKNKLSQTAEAYNKIKNSQPTVPQTTPASKPASKPTKSGNGNYNNIKNDVQQKNSYKTDGSAWKSAAKSVVNTAKKAAQNYGETQATNYMNKNKQASETQKQYDTMRKNIRNVVSDNTTNTNNKLKNYAKTVANGAAKAAQNVGGNMATNYMNKTAQTRANIDNASASGYATEAKAAAKTTWEAAKKYGGAAIDKLSKTSGRNMVTESMNRQNAARTNLQGTSGYGDIAKRTKKKLKKTAEIWNQ